jgi:hypothetical protein
MKTINEFKKGDIVTRVKPGKELNAINFFNEEPMVFGADRSYIGEKLIFVGLANGCAYFKRTNPLEIRIFGDKLIDLPLDVFEDGWDNWIDPNSLLDEEEFDDKKKLDDEELKKMIQKAINDEDYELAQKLNNILKK